MAPPLQPLPDDVIPGILLRLPPNDPASIIRAAAVCKSWRRTIADVAFAGRYRALHPKGPVLGFLHNQSMLHVSRFVPTTSFRPSPAADHRRRHAHDCRHGRAFFFDYDSLGSFVVWDPVTGDEHKIPDVPDVLTQPAVDRPAALVGDALYIVGESGFLLRYRYGLLRRYSSYMGVLSAGFREADILSVIEPPQGKRLGNVFVMTTEDGGLGLASLYPNSHRLYLWERETGPGGDEGRWVKDRAIDLKMLLPISNPKSRPCLIGVAEDINAIVVSTRDGVFVIELKSSQVKKMCEEMGKVDHILPFVSFYTDSLLMKLASSKLPAPVENQ
ncbi:hypothetical protein BAE44_0006705 [Dichanthelium oligosanthes]|uniref:F-box domain-containing protein n=1 Tax=Dichanthelium oligosanthes TaxID=888268 RepID=A0A1E5W4H1_9POAL|nr:hypothetical protein BAE44_0006705 [Dichanthelium oligosanthes]